jgi:hypothetical protein
MYSTDFFHTDIAKMVVATGIALPILRLLYWLWFETIDTFHSMDDVGYSHVKGNSKVSKQAIINRMRRNRKTGNMPPPFPNGWYVILEGRSASEVYLFCFRHLYTTYIFPPNYHLCTFICSFLLVGSSTFMPLESILQSSEAKNLVRRL